MRLLICAGGTGGGVYPAIAVLQRLKDEHRKREHIPLSLLWVGGAGGMEAELVKRANLPFEAIPAAGLHGVGLRALPGNLWQLCRGLFAARRILRQFRPEVTFFTGGFVAMPVALAARLPGLGFPRPVSLLYVPDVEPGLALKTLSRFADHIAVTAESSRRYFPSQKSVTVSGYPVRSDLHPGNVVAARYSLGLSAELPTLLVFGGSKGARSINRALFAVLPDLLAEMQVVHIGGTLDWPEVETARSTLSADQLARYRPYPYLHEEIGAAMAAADLVISRAGAATLGEYPLFGLPAVLVPYPYAWRYQQVNASYLAERGAAIIVADAELPERLLPLVRSLMRDPSRREAMRQAMRSLSRPAAADSIARLLVSLAATRSHGRN